MVSLFRLNILIIIVNTFLTFMFKHILMSRQYCNLITKCHQEEKQ
jgi:hypothetical protein